MPKQRLAGALPFDTDQSFLFSMEAKIVMGRLGTNVCVLYPKVKDAYISVAQAIMDWYTLYGKGMLSEPLKERDPTLGTLSWLAFGELCLTCTDR